MPMFHQKVYMLTQKMTNVDAPIDPGLVAYTATRTNAAPVVANRIPNPIVNAIWINLLIKAYNFLSTE